MFPVAKNEILIRIDNLEDEFDSISQPINSLNVKIEKFVLNMYKEVN